MTEYDEGNFEPNEESPIEDASPTLPDPVPAEAAEAEKAESESDGVVWLRGENGKLYKA